MKTWIMVFLAGILGIFGFAFWKYQERKSATPTQPNVTQAATGAASGKNADKIINTANSIAQLAQNAGPAIASFGNVLNSFGIKI